MCVAEFSHKMNDVISPDEYCFIKADEPMFFLNQYANSNIEEMLNSNNISLIPPIGGKSAEEVYPELLANFQFTKIFLHSPSQYLFSKNS